MEEEYNAEKVYWSTCLDCRGQGRKSRGLSKKVRVRYERAMVAFENSEDECAVAPNPPLLHMDPCMSCDGSGLRRAESYPEVDSAMYPMVAIIGGGIGGMALAVACFHRGIPFRLFERDEGFAARSQGYGLTLQQASKAIEGLGVYSLEGGVISTRHIVHTTDGNVIGEWGIRKWLRSNDKSPPKRTNVHIARQSLRMSVLEQLGGHDEVKWGHQFLGYERLESGGMNLRFEVGGEVKHFDADLLVGADGIRSVVRRGLIGEEVSPLKYLGCIVILGICPLERLVGVESDLLDSATVFQTVNGHERIYMMPYDADSVMWQLSFPMSEEDAKALSSEGAEALREEACRRTRWHDPVPAIMVATHPDDITGYPVYDRELLDPEMLESGGDVTLIGDAAHPMSPFKGQGANQALLDALALARGITKGCAPGVEWRERGLRGCVLRDFEVGMLARSAVKVRDSAEAARFLHSDVVLHQGDEPRGRCLKRSQND